jgi:uncharacterized protein (TIGR04255 family)
MGLFEHVLTAFIETYNPPFFTRVGLRYIDIFNRSILGLKDVGWDRLIKKVIIPDKLSHRSGSN